MYFLKKVRFIATILDLVHLNYSLFPEISYEEYKLREDLHLCVARNSFLIITSCQTLKDEISKRYNQENTVPDIMALIRPDTAEKIKLFYNRDYELIREYGMDIASIVSERFGSI